MTLPTTRIDTHYPPVQHGDNPLRHNNAQEMLLVDFVPNGPVGNNGPTTSMSPPISSSTMIPNRFNSYPIQVQQLPNHLNHNNHSHSHSIHNNNVSQNNNNDLSNYTLVNLSNQPERDEDDDDDEEESQVFFKDHIPLRRTYLPGGAIPVANHNVKVSSSMSSSSSTEGDSDTGFLVPQNGVKSRSLGKDKHYKLQSSAVPPSTSYPGSPGFNSVQQLHRKRLRRRRSSGRRKPHNEPKHDESGDLISICCCFGDDDHPQRSGQNSTSLANRYLRYSCVIVMIIALATFASIMVSLQRKVDSLSWEVKKYSAAGSQGTTIPSNQASPNPSPLSLQDLIAKNDQLNSSYTSLKTVIDELNLRVLNLEKQTKGLPPSVEEVRKDLATLGSELEGSIKEMQKDLQDFKIANAMNKNDKDPNGAPANPGGDNSAGATTIATLGTES